MIGLLPRLVSRDGSDNGDDGLSPTIVDLLIALLVLVLVVFVLVGGLLVLRRRRQKRRQQQSELPIHNGQCSPNHRLTISASPSAKRESVLVLDEKRRLMENSSPPDSPVPEIRITFPEEEDEAGKRKSGRVVIVRISEGGGVGLEPYQEELPPYQASDANRFHSLDIERMGGLKEKEDVKRWS
ncbi:hypothetical protein PHISCL_01999 [Aspergillus sclerotialis]|uniref:Uncharacterized protein n=1 Tax=Aspergillus sclerotialis TaxID=2070753 RepID=A0A3A2ZR72_9EURO|nr:hypothetical protein PHISCL_01999 [Aspergillus sclerotialis]